jgi:hypothetical protein
MFLRVSDEHPIPVRFRPFLDEPALLQALRWIRAFQQHVAAVALNVVLALSLIQLLDVLTGVLKIISGDLS